ncbi:MAG: carbohydrate kinase family protein [Thermoprotei archaeon]
MILLSGFVLVDLVAADLPYLPPPGDIVFAPRGISAYPGGHPDNVASTLVRLGHDPKDVALIGAIGRDVFGSFLKEEMGSLGINLLFHEVTAGTGKTLSLKPKGKDRSFISDVGANLLFDASWVTSAIEDMRPSAFYMAGGILGRGDEGFGTAFAKAKEIGALTFADYVKPLGKGWEYLVSALPYVDVLHLNREEAYAVTGERDWERSAKILSKMGVRMAVVTDESGALASWDGGRKALFQPSFKVEVVDTTAAGDSFVAGLMEKMMAGIPEEEKGVQEALSFAQATAAVKCTGVSTSAVNRNSVEELLRERS